MIDNISVIAGLGCLVWAAWQVSPWLGWASIGAALLANGIGGFRLKAQAAEIQCGKHNCAEDIERLI